MLKQALSADFKSNITIDSCLMGDLKPLQDTGYYTSQYVVENEVLKLGSFKSVKIPVTDKLVSTDIFDDKERKYDFDFVRYEPFEYYSHEMEVKLDNELTFVEVPKTSIWPTMVASITWSLKNHLKNKWKLKGHIL